MSAARSGATLDVLLTFDVEDVFSPPEVGNDDSIKELAEIMSEEGVPGVFLFIADRAEQLVRRGRQDVIRAVARHEIGLHTRSARHPCPPEYVANKSWCDGVSEALARESEGLAVIERVFSRPACAMSTHNVFTSPHAHAVAGKLRLPLVYAYPAAPPLYSLSWYCGSLCLPAWNPAHGEVSRAYGLEWDDFYPDPKAFEAQLARHDAHIDQRIAEGQPYLTQLLYHPQRLRLAEFIDHFWAANGVSLAAEAFGTLGQPRRYSDDAVSTAKINFRRLVRKLRDDPRLRVLTMADLVARYGSQHSTIPMSELIDGARASARAKAVLRSVSFSAAEILLGMTEAIAEFQARGKLPESVGRVATLGPIENPIIQPEVRKLSWSELVAAAARCRRDTFAAGNLPASFGPVFSRFGVNHLYVALAETLLDLHAGRTVESIELHRVPRNPPEAEAIGRRFLSICEGELVDPQLNIDALYRHGKLQTWTLKPATAKAVHPNLPLS
jgi:hypothetical protein